MGGATGTGTGTGTGAGTVQYRRRHRRITACRARSKKTCVILQTAVLYHGTPTYPAYVLLLSRVCATDTATEPVGDF